MTSIPAEPYFFNPIFKEKIWGGTALFTKLGKEIPVDTLIGESWELCGFGDTQSTVCDGVFVDRTLGALFNDFRAEIANRLTEDDFPILLKFLDSNQKLSVQLHPNGQYAQKMGWGNRGKDECWYIVDAQEDARLILGFKNRVTRDDVFDAIKSNSLEELLNFVPVKNGDVFYIPAGTVHAILEGSLIYEIQQPSDLTLRLYDWGRTDSSGKPRELHIEQSLDFMDTSWRDYKITPIEFLHGDYTHKFRVATRFFSIEEFEFLKKTSLDLPAKKYFRILTALNGPVQLHFGTGSKTLGVGQTALIPAICANLSVEADNGCNLLCSTFPDLQSDIITPLRKMDIPIRVIQQLAGNWNNNDLESFFSH